MATRRKNTGQGVRLDSQSKEMLLNVYTYFKRLQSKTRSKGAFERTLEATRVSSYALCKVVKEGKKEEASFSSPKKRYKSTREGVNTRTDSFDRGAIRRKMYEIYEKRAHHTHFIIGALCMDVVITLYMYVYFTESFKRKWSVHWSAYKAIKITKGDGV